MSDEEIARCLDPRHFVDHHRVTGATAPREVRRMAASREAELAVHRQSVDALRHTLDQAGRELRRAISNFVEKG